jgi:hypothetical protein
MNDLPDALNRLATRLETLERRVYALEHPAEASSPVPALEMSQQATAQAAETPSLAGGAFPVLGRAMLGIAGAYLLRAVAESSSLPRLAVAAIAIVYAILWLVGAARVPAGDWFAGTTYACTSALILAPMLWEVTLRFKVMPAGMAAGALAAFVCAAAALTWKASHPSVLWVANATGAAVAVTLGVASHELTPFIAVLLLMVLIAEAAAARDRGTGVRALAAAGADLAIWVLIFIYASPQSKRTDYPSLAMPALLAPGIALFLIFACSVAFRTVPQMKQLSVFETIQTIIAFLLAATSLLYFGPHYAPILLGAVCLILSASAYAAVFLIFDRMTERRNYKVFAAWSAALLLAGTLLCLPSLWAAASLGAAAIVATVMGARLSRPVLDLHGMVYLLAAAAAGGLFSYAFGALAGSLPTVPPLSVCLVSACAAVCYAACKSRKGEPLNEQIFHLVSASLAILAVAALLVHGLVGLTALRVNPEAHHLAFIRTLIICVAALALAYGGAHWRRMELTRLGYATLALAAAKLVFEDLRHGHLEFIAAAIFLFAITLIAVPRIARMGQRA